jgi:Bacterial mobilisation protein (MobC)
MRGDTARLAGGAAPVHPDQEGRALAGPPMRRRSGSDKRKRTAVLPIRLTPEERRLIDGNAERAALTAASYARHVLLGVDPPRQARRPPVEKRELGRLLGLAGNIASNINQIARVLNGGGEADLGALDHALAELTDMRRALLTALRRDP